MSEEELKNTTPQEEDAPTEQDDLAKSLEEATQGWKRALADYDNLKKDLMKEKQAARDAVKRGFAMDLLPVLENFQAATGFQPEGLDSAAQNWLQGILYIQNQLEQVIESRLDMTPFTVEPGTIFNADEHEAVGSESDPDQPDQVILKLVKKGWKQHGDTICVPAKVIINSIETNEQN